MNTKNKSNAWYLFFKMIIFVFSIKTAYAQPSSLSECFDSLKTHSVKIPSLAKVDYYPPAFAVHRDTVWMLLPQPIDDNHIGFIRKDLKNKSVDTIIAYVPSVIYKSALPIAKDITVNNFYLAVTFINRNDGFALFHRKKNALSLKKISTLAVPVNSIHLHENTLILGSSYHGNISSPRKQVVLIYYFIGTNQFSYHSIDVDNLWLSMLTPYCPFAHINGESIFIHPDRYKIKSFTVNHVKKLYDKSSKNVHTLKPIPENVINQYRSKVLKRYYQSYSDAWIDDLVFNYDSFRSEIVFYMNSNIVYCYSDANTKVCDIIDKNESIVFSELSNDLIYLQNSALGKPELNSLTISIKVENNNLFIASLKKVNGMGYKVNIHQYISNSTCF